MDAVGIAVLLATMVKAVLDRLLQPVVSRWPEIDLWWMDYVAFVLGAGVTWLAGINLLAVLLPGQELLGRILTALVVGGGVPLINDLFGAAQGRSALYRGLGTGRPRVRGW